MTVCLPKSQTQTHISLYSTYVHMCVPDRSCLCLQATARETGTRLGSARAQGRCCLPCRCRQQEKRKTPQPLTLPPITLWYHWTAYRTCHRWYGPGGAHNRQPLLAVGTYNPHNTSDSTEDLYNSWHSPLPSFSGSPTVPAITSQWTSYRTICPALHE